MEEYRKKDDRGRSKAERLTKGDPKQKVDSSTWTPPEAENAGVKTGARPLTKRLYKKGGKVVGKSEGKNAEFRADRKPRKAGGRALTADSLVNRDVREANEERECIKHTGAFKKGGKVHKLGGGALQGYINAADKDIDSRNATIERHRYDTDPAYRKIVAKNKNKVASREKMIELAQDKIGRKSGGRAHKLGGGMLGNNPVTDQYQKTADAAMHKKGGKVKKREHHDGANGNVVGAQNPPPDYDTVMKNAAAALAASKNTMKGTDANRAKNAAAFDAEQAEYQRSLPQNRKRGGKVHPDEAADKALIKRMVKPSALERKRGGNVFEGNSKEKIPGAVGGRHAHAKGGRTKGSTTINIVMAGRGGQGQGSMPDAPVQAPKPPMGVPVPPPQMAGGMPPQMPPQGGMPMPRKSGGRTGKFGGGAMGMRPMSMGPSTTSGSVVGQQTLQPNRVTPPAGGSGELAPAVPTSGSGFQNPMSGFTGVRDPAAWMARMAPMQAAARNAANYIPSSQQNSGGSTNENRTQYTGAGMPSTGGQDASDRSGGAFRRGGRTSYPIDAGSGGGEGRLEKIKAYGLKPPRGK